MQSHHPDTAPVHSLVYFLPALFLHSFCFPHLSSHRTSKFVFCFGPFVVICYISCVLSEAISVDICIHIFSYVCYQLSPLIGCREMQRLH